MRRKISRFLKHRFLRLYVRINRSIVKDEVLTESQKNIMRILRKMMLSNESDMMNAPLSDTYYVKC